MKSKPLLLSSYLNIRRINKAVAIGLLLIMASAFSVSAQDQNELTVSSQFLQVYVDEAQLAQVLPQQYLPTDYKLDPFYQDSMPGNLYPLIFMQGIGTATFHFSGKPVAEEFQFLVILIPVKTTQTIPDRPLFFLHSLSCSNPLIRQLLDDRCVNSFATELTTEESVMPNGTISIISTGTTEQTHWELNSRSTELEKYILPSKTMNILRIINTKTQPVEILLKEGSYQRAVFKDKGVSDLMELLGFNEIRWSGSRSLQISFVAVF